MKLLVALCIFAFIAHVSAISAPQVVYDGPTYELKRIDDDVSNVKPRMADDYDSVDDSTDLTSRPRRVTCDVLSWQSRWFSFNHSACAVRCLAQRRRGGRCQNGVCVCR